MAKAIQCPACTNWLVEPQAAFQGVSFTEGEARAVADLLNAMAEVRKARKAPEEPIVLEIRMLKAEFEQ